LRRSSASARLDSAPCARPDADLHQILADDQAA
jgi:hypothetical protein